MSVYLSSWLVILAVFSCGKTQFLSPKKQDDSHVRKITSNSDEAPLNNSEVAIDDHKLADVTDPLAQSPSGERENEEDDPSQSGDERKIIAEMVQSFLSPNVESFSSDEKKLAKLGKEFFFDARFSENGQISCANCHQPEKFLADGLARAKGLLPINRNSPTVVNSRFNSWQFWNGRKTTLTSQALGPIESPAEHGISRGRLAQLVFLHYRDKYEAIFGHIPTRLVRFFNKQSGVFHAMPQMPVVKLDDPVANFAVDTIAIDGVLNRILDEADSSGSSPNEVVASVLMGNEVRADWAANHDSLSDTVKTTIDHIFLNFGRAVAQYEIGLIALNSPFDRFSRQILSGRSKKDSFVAGFGSAELAGLKLFVQRGRCAGCHSGPMFTDGRFHNIGFGQFEELKLGRSVGVHLAKLDPFNCPEEALGNPNFSSCQSLNDLDSKNKENVGAFRTPSLRNVAKTAPYMHDGSVETLMEVIETYNKLDSVAPIGNRVLGGPLGLSQTEVKLIEKFLRSLNAPITDLGSQRR